jgi:heme oxygenase
MLIREKSIKDEYRDLVEAELAKKEAEEKALAEAAEKALGSPEEIIAEELKAEEPPKGRKIKKPRKKK